MKKHIEHINLVLEYLYRHNLYLKLEKYEFHNKKVNFLNLMIR